MTNTSCPARTSVGGPDPVTQVSSNDDDPRPDSRVLHRHAHSRLPYAVAGDGPYVIDRDGKRYLDACGGAAVSCLGHSDQDVIAAFRVLEPKDMLGGLSAPIHPGAMKYYKERGWM